jgi:hypothetical protein
VLEKDMFDDVLLNGKQARRGYSTVRLRRNIIGLVECLVLEHANRKNNRETVGQILISGADRVEDDAFKIPPGPIMYMANQTCGEIAPCLLVSWKDVEIAVVWTLHKLEVTKEQRQ